MKALLVIDVQNDFCPGGALAVQGGDVIVPLINTLRKQYPLVVFTQDWHPRDHLSFATNHPGKNPGDHIDLDGISQILWPVHCVQNTPGARFHPMLEVLKDDPIFRKGTDRRIDSYSAFYDNAHLKSTELSEFLKTNKIKTLGICGLATDYCVKFSVLDALAEGFTVEVFTAACRGVNLEPSDSERAIKEMRMKGATIL